MRTGIRPLPLRPSNPLPKAEATFKVDSQEEFRIFPRKWDPDLQKEVAHPITIRKAIITITTIYGERVTFGTTNRAQTYFDSRTPKRISEEECRSEVFRFLGKTEAERAWAVLDGVH